MLDPQNRTRWWDLPAVSCIALAFFLAATRLDTANWTQYLWLNKPLVWLSVALGLMLGWSRFRGATVWVFTVAFGLGIPGMSILAILHDPSWTARLETWGSRLLVILGQVFRNQAVTDPILFLTSMVFLFWFTAFGSAFAFTRLGKPWFGLAPVGVMVFIVDYSFDIFNAPDSGAIFSVFFMITVLALAARVYFAGSARRWTSQGSQVESEVSGDLGRAALLAALFLAAGAWFSPLVVRTLTPGSNANLRLTAGIEKFRERFTNAFNALRSPASVTVYSITSSMTLGQSANLSEDLVFTARPGGIAFDSVRLYWSGRYYDTFEDGRWQATEPVLKDLGPQVLSYHYDWDYRVSLAVEFESQLPATRMLYFPGALSNVDRYAQAVSMKDPRGQEDLTAVLVNPPLETGMTYKTESLVSVPTVLAMRESSGKTMPIFIRETYTQLPEGFSPKIRALAREVTSGITKPYDQVQAITNYLRNTYRYEAILPSMPEDADPLEWFLFDHKAGFCNYYASAEVLMLRSRGIPARLGVGYASGIWNEEKRVYEVRGQDYHAWPEVFFPGLGWVPFEPTTNQRALSYPQGQEFEGLEGPAQPIPTATLYIPSNAGFEGGIAGDLRDVLAREAAERTLTLALSGFAVLAAAGIIWWGAPKLRRRRRGSGRTPLAVRVEKLLLRSGLRVPQWLRRWAEISRRTPLEQEFALIPDTLKRMGKLGPAGETPREQERRLADILTGARAHSAVILNEFEKDQFSKTRGNIDRAQAAGRILRRLAAKTLLLNSRLKR